MCSSDLQAQANRKQFLTQVWAGYRPKPQNQWAREVKHDLIAHREPHSLVFSTLLVGQIAVPHSEVSGKLIADALPDLAPYCCTHRCRSPSESPPQPSPCEPAPIGTAPLPDVPSTLVTLVTSLLATFLCCARRAYYGVQRNMGSIDPTDLFTYVLPFFQYSA